MTTSTRFLISFTFFTLVFFKLNLSFDLIVRWSNFVLVKVNQNGENILLSWAIMIMMEYVWIMQYLIQKSMHFYTLKFYKIQQ